MTRAGKSSAGTATRRIDDQPVDECHGVTAHSVPCQAKSPFFRRRPPSRSLRDRCRRRPRSPAAIAASRSAGVQLRSPNPSAVASCSSSSQVRPDGRLGRKARSNRWTRPWTFVNVPSFSASEAAGRTTSAARVSAFDVRAHDREEPRAAEDRHLLRDRRRRPRSPRPRRRRPRARPCRRARRRARSRPCPGARPMSRAPRKLARGVVALDPLGLRLDPADARLVHDDVAVGTGEVVGELAQQEVLLVGEVRRAEEEEPGRPRPVDRRGGSPTRSARSPAGTMMSWTELPCAQRRLVDVPRVQALREEPAVVAEPVVVDVGVQPRQEPVDDVFLGLDRDVAADVAARADRRSSPGTRRGCGSGTPAS